ncbi:LysR family transcriptional regulator [Alginatibacterium sediminis]|uniref:LysR family transcriptional regulator n=1 Tax=Alginatibacterium sediminis TaxID=2164068 RepID=A0A420E8Z9_9ALTE|nr:LysR family transcriptional regulator [Alginatibacterium sediminis]RKF15851.1 LysR family transcriptional regulator [Alginatibacterium sediminis]
MLELFDYDLNQLKTLTVLLQEKHTGRAAERLNTTQPVVSRTLAKIRKAIGDPLFIRRSHGFELTPRAERLALELPDTLQQLENLLRDDHFSAKALTGKLRIATNVLLMELYGYRIIQALKTHAPGLQLELLDFGARTSEQIITGEIDAAISFPFELKSKQLRHESLSEVNFGLICRSELKDLPDEVDLEQAAQYPIAGLIVPTFNQNQPLIEQYASWDLKLAFRSQHLGPVLQAVRQSDTLFIGLLELAQVLDPQLFRMIRVKGSFPISSARVNYIYSNSQHYSSKHHWLINLFRREFDVQNPDTDCALQTK